MSNKTELTVLITGASRGMGKSMAAEFAIHGCNLVLVARNQDDLNQVKSEIIRKSDVNVKTVAMNLTNSYAADSLFKQLGAANIRVDVLVNNAGIGVTGDFANNNPAQLNNMLQLNIVSLTRLTQLFLQPMLARHYGRILNVSSLVAYFSGAPNWASYVASKHYVRAFTRGLARELRGSGVSATVLSPGATSTDFGQSSGADHFRAYQQPGGQSVEQIAKQAYRACMSGKAEIIPGRINKILAFLGELPPRRIAFEVFAYLSQNGKA